MLNDANFPPGKPEPGILDSPTLRDGSTYKLVRGTSKLLWVIMSPRNMPDGHFAFYRRGLELSGWKLFLRSPVEDFYQLMMDDIASAILRMKLLFGVDRVIYMGFSAGAFAALVLGLNDTSTQRVLALGPQFRLDHPLTIAYRTLKPVCVDSRRFDPKYFDLVSQLQRTDRRCDIFLGVYDMTDGISVKESLQIANSRVRFHYLRWGHDVGAAIAKLSAYAPLLASVEKDGDIKLPSEMYSDNSEVTLATRIYDLAKAIEHDNVTPQIPNDSDIEVKNPVWWNIKSRIRYRHGDIYGAIADIVRAIALNAEDDGNYVCAGNYFKELKQFEFATAAYKRASLLSSDSYNGHLGLASVLASQGKVVESTHALAEAKKRGAPINSVHKILEVLKTVEKRDNSTQDCDSPE